MTDIFRDNAPLYWGVGLPVIPLRQWNSPAKGAGKAPILNEWTTYARQMPSLEIRDLWMASYAQSNIGLPFGPASGLCGIDIDTEDEALTAAILDALPATPWIRIGRKGMGLIYKWNGQRNFKLRDNENQSLMEFLGEGNQMVLPPSIHPMTGMPYTANSCLWEVMDKIQGLPVNIEQVLRDALGDVLGERGVTLAQGTRSKPLDVVPEGERDIQMIRHAGYLARVVQGIDKSMALSLADAISHMHTWVVDFTSSCSGDDMDPNKGVAKLLEFLMKDVEKGMTMPDGWDVGLTEAMLADGTIMSLKEKNHVARWTFSKAKAWFDAEVAGDPSDDQVLTALGSLVAAVAADDNFSELEFSTLTNYIMAKVGKSLGLSKPDLKKLFKDSRKEQAGGDAEADHEAIAQRVIADFSRAGELKHAMGKFWRWSGSCFEQIDEADIFDYIAKHVKGNQLARRHNDYASLVKTVAILCRGELSEGMETGINFANGFLDIAGELHEHSPKFGKTFTMPFNYVPERASEAHRWFEYLERAWGDDPDYQDKVDALQEAFAATIFGVAPQYQRAFLLYGKAGTGKSQALEVLRALMPPRAVATLPPAKWGERFQLTALVGKTLNVCGELPEATVIHGETFKQVVEGAYQNSEFKGHDSFDFKPLAAHWFASNHLPRSRDFSKGFTRRWLVLEFNRVVPAEERVPDFHTVLVAEEREAIAAWAVQGLERLRKQGDYSQPISHQDRINQIARANNSVLSWLQLNDKVRPTSEFKDSCDAGDVYNEYVFYCKEVIRSMAATYSSFVEMIEELGHKRGEYRDAAGVLRQKIHNLRMRTAEERFNAKI